MKIRRSMILACLCAGIFVLAGCGSDDDSGGNGNGNGNGGTTDTADAGDNGMSGEDTMAGEDTSEDDGMSGGEDTNTGEDTSNGGGSDCQPLDPPPVQGASCSILCQDCSGSQACIIGQNQEGNQVQACQPAGQGGQGDTCGPQSGCQAGFGCFVTEQGSQEGTCQKYCRPNSSQPPQCDENATCQPLQSMNGVGACVVQQDNCQLHPNDSCGEGQTCTMTARGKQCVSYNDSASAGDSCQAPSDCNQYQICAASQGGGGNQCLQLCDPEDPQNCSENQTCRQANLGGTTINICR